LFYKLFGRADGGLNKLRTFVRSQVEHHGDRINEQVQPTSKQTILTESEEQHSSRPTSGRVGNDGQNKNTTTTSSTNKHTSWVNAVAELKTNFDELLRDAFSADKEFEVALNEVYSRKAIPGGYF
jgi:hypothetical protein